MLSAPSTFAALLTSLRVGFRTITIEQKAGEVSERLEQVKRAFSRYADLLGKAKKSLQQASRAVDDAERGSGRLRRELGDIENGVQGNLSDGGFEQDGRTLAATGDL
jgi:DNA recombination protein RmuC